MAIAYISLGSNLGSKLHNINKAVALIAEECGTINNISAFYETEPWGFESDKKFLNQVLSLTTGLTPSELLSGLLSIEKMMGRTRERSRTYTSRIIDLDILFYDQKIIREENLTIPHPQIQNRSFILVPLMEIAASFVHPQLNKTIERLTQDCMDNSFIRKI